MENLKNKIKERIKLIHEALYIIPNDSFLKGELLGLEIALKKIEEEQNNESI